MFHHDCSLTVKPASMPWRLVQKKIWRDSLPVDMLLSAVSVLVVVQPNSEVPEGLMNYHIFNNTLFMSSSATHGTKVGIISVSLVFAPSSFISLFKKFFSKIVNSFSSSDNSFQDNIHCDSSLVNDSVPCLFDDALSFSVQI